MASSSQVITWRCAVCGCLKGETNHWLTLKRIVGEELGPIFLLRQFNPRPGDGEVAICGDVCAGKALQTYLTELRGVTPPHKQQLEYFPMEAAFGGSRISNAD